VWDHWEVDEDGYVADSYDIDAAREFRFDSARARYLARNLDPATLTGSTPTVMPLSPQLWTMYDGDEPYLDFDVDDDGTTMTQTDTKQYVAGLAELDLLTSATSYLHGDLIRSLVGTTDDNGTFATGTFAYTAFGEPAGAADPLAVTRYTYAGGWGYEDGLIVLVGQDAELPPLTLSHVGARWYQPDIGRFVQRDPIGIEGGRNVYLYNAGDPVRAVDPMGLDRWIVGSGLHQGIVVTDPAGGFTEVGSKMQVVGEDEPSFHTVKDDVQNLMNIVLCASTGGVGEIAVGPAGNPGRPPDVKSTSEEDAAFLREFYNGKHVYYNAWWGNCRNWARRHLKWGLH